AIGLLLLIMLRTDSHGWVAYFGMLPIMMGMATAMSPCTALIMSAVPANRAGMGSASNDTSRELGGALGVAVLGSVVATTFKANIDSGVVPEAARAAVESGLPGALKVAGALAEVNPTVAAGLMVDARTAFVDGLHIATVVGAVVVGITAVAAAAVLRHLPASAMRLAQEMAEEPAAGMGDDIEPGTASAL
ncbi:MAG TPA: hypothetical protein PLV68_14055, partial [Ilumatobacteraceae bacterium]|nr:hypothetical protein [Ilumatobacteraceae bacterium]